MLHWHIFRFLNVNSCLIEGNTLSINWKFTYKYSTLWKKLFKKVWSWLARAVGWELRGHSARPPPDQASATPLPLSWRAPVQFQSLRRGRLTFSSRSKSSCTPYHPPVQEWACEMIHNKGWKKKKWFAGLSENFWKPTPPCLPGYVQWALGPRATQSREFHKQSRSSKITSKALWTSNSVSKGGWVSVTCSQGFLTHPSDVFWTLWAVSSRSWYRICGVLVQNENAGFLGQNYWEFQDGDCTALNQGQGPS